MEARQSVIIRNPNYPESQRKRPDAVVRSSVICTRQENVSRVRKAVERVNPCFADLKRWPHPSSAVYIQYI